MKSELSPSGFTFLTNHAHVLVRIAQESDVRMRELAVKVGITERAVQRIIDDLAATGYIQVTKEGRRNHYTVPTGTYLRHPLERHCTVGDFLGCVTPRSENGNGNDNPS
jgi:predicted transcriptional regulator